VGIDVSQDNVPTAFIGRVTFDSRGRQVAATARRLKSVVENVWIARGFLVYEPTTARRLLLKGSTNRGLMNVDAVFVPRFA
jgi:hypothetical protein